MKKKIINQELEDAGLKWFKNRMMSGKGVLTTMEIFKAGATWQKEQSATDAIQFAEWLDIETKQSENRWFIERSEGYTYPNLYKLWLKTKNI